MRGGGFPRPDWASWLRARRWLLRRFAAFSGGSGAEGSKATEIGADVPDTWDVVVANGVVWASDVNTGLIGLHFVGDEMGDGAQTSTG